MKGRGTRAVVTDVAGKEPIKTVLVVGGDPDQLTHCDWASNARLVCGIYAIDGKGRDALSLTRLFALDADGGNRVLLTALQRGDVLAAMQSGGQVIDWFGDEAGSSVLMTRQFVPDTTNTTQPGYAVERVDPVTLRRSVIERPNAEAEE